MAIKKFNTPDETPAEPTAPTPAEVAKGSKFSPWLKKEDPKKKPLGNKVYTAESGTEGKYTSNEDLTEALLIRAEDAFKQAEKLVQLYEKATRNPTRANVIAYSDAIKEVVKGDTETSAAVLSVLIATLCSMFGPGRR